MLVTIDRFEGEFAVCEDENRNMVNIERNRMPLNVKEGDVLDIDGNDIKLCLEETRLREKRIKEIMDKLWE